MEVPLLPKSAGGRVAQRATDDVQRVIHAAAAPDWVAGAGCLLLDGDGGLRFVAATGSPGRVLEAAEELCVEGPCHEAFVTGADVVVRDLQGDARWPRLGMLLATTPVQTALSTAIMLDGAPIGSLNVFATDQEWTADDIARVRGCADEVGFILAHGLIDIEAKHVDPLLRQVGEALEHREILREAAEMIAESTGSTVPTAALRLRQVAAMSCQAAAIVAARVVEEDVVCFL